MPGYYFVQSGGGNDGNGYPGNPANRIPTVLPAGSKVFVNGVYLWSHSNPYDLLPQGTPEAPVWILSYDPEKPALGTGSLIFRPGSRYAIVSNIDWDFSKGAPGASSSVGAAGGDYGQGPQKASYICFRDGKVKGTGIIDPKDPNFKSGDRLYNSSLAGCSGLDGPRGERPSWEGCAEQIVFYNMLITQGGNWQYAEGDPDGSGAVIGLFSQDVWVVDCEFSYFSGSAAGFGIGTPSTLDADCTRRAYIGRNLAHHIAQSAFWSKRSEDCVFSENTIYGLRHDTPSSPNSCGVGAQYGPRNFWVLFNTIHDCPTGIRIEGGIGEVTGPITDTDIYIIGNLIYDIHSDPAVTPNPDWRTSDGNQGSGTGIHLRGGKDHYVINNTIHDFDSGIISPLIAHNRIIEGNILSKRNSAVPGVDIFLYQNPAGKNKIANNLIEGVAGKIYVEQDGKLHTTIAALNAAKGPDNILAAPTYVDAARTNFALSKGSRGIDVFGQTANIVYPLFNRMYSRNIAFDRIGTARPQNGNWDLGAFEYTDKVNQQDPPVALPPVSPGSLGVLPK